MQALAAEMMMSVPMVEPEVVSEVVPIMVPIVTAVMTHVMPEVPHVIRSRVIQLGCVLGLALDGN
jgi:hypothetical protein